MVAGTVVLQQKLLLRRGHRWPTLSDLQHLNKCKRRFAGSTNLLLPSTRVAHLLFLPLWCWGQRRCAQGDLSYILSFINSILCQLEMAVQHGDLNGFLQQSEAKDSLKPFIGKYILSAQSAPIQIKTEKSGRDCTWQHRGEVWTCRLPPIWQRFRKRNKRNKTEMEIKWSNIFCGWFVVLGRKTKTSQELRMLSSVTIYCQITKIVMNSGSQLSEL